MKSNFAYQRLLTTFNKKEEYKGIETYSRNIQSLDVLEDVITFWQPELFILDTKLSDIAKMSAMVENHFIPVIYFDSDFEEVLNQVNHYFKHENDNEDDETRKQIEYVAVDAPKEKEIIYKERVIEKEVVKTSYTSVPNKIIVIGSLWHGAGATTLAMNLARAIAERGLVVSYVEYPTLKPYMFDFLSIPMKEEEQNTKYIDYARNILERGRVLKKNFYWHDNGVNWYVIDSRYEPIDTFSYDDMLKFVYSINSTITIIDVSSKLSDVQDFLHHADEIFVCIEPDPVKFDWTSTVEREGKRSSLQRKEKVIIDFLNDIEKSEGISYQFVNMKYSKKIDVKTWAECLANKKAITSIPSISYDDLIECVWKSQILYDRDGYRELLEKHLKPIISKILPREFYDIKREGPKRDKLFGLLKRSVAK